MYFFVQIERALLREGLEADGALERPLACDDGRARTGDRETKQNHDGQIIHYASYVPLYPSHTMPNHFTLYTVPTFTVH